MHATDTQKHSLTLTCRLKGGIGNQLFQYAFAQSMSLRLSTPLVFDDTFFQSDTYSNQSVLHRCLPDLRFVSSPAQDMEGTYALREGSIRSLDDVRGIPHYVTNLLLDGYWQSEDYFYASVMHHFYKSLKARIGPSLKASLTDRILSSKQAIAIHIRRRDYGHMGICCNAYFVAAVKYLSFAFPESNFFVFSDEPNFTTHLFQLINVPYVLVATGDDLGDLLAMSLCTHFVTSNSSFSWWGAWFSENSHTKKGQIIIAPKEWTTVDQTPSPCPSRWLLVPNSVIEFSINHRDVERHFDYLVGARSNWHSDFRITTGQHES